jgi:hypothetical protein
MALMSRFLALGGRPALMASSARPLMLDMPVIFLDIRLGNPTPTDPAVQRIDEG